MEQITAALDGIDWEAMLVSLISSLFRIMLILVIAWGMIKVALMSLRRMERMLVDRGREDGVAPSETIKRVETLLKLIRQAAIVLIWVVTFLVVLREIGVEIMPILASAGIAGLALGFGAQNLVRDVISGFFIILENQVRVGDVAVVNGTGGLVEKVNFRTLVLRDLEGTVHVFPNGTIDTLSNMTRDWSGYVIDVRVAYGEDADRVIGIMKKVGAELKEDAHYGHNMLSDVEVFGVDDFGESALIVKGRIRTKPIMQWETGREYRRRLKKAFDREGVEIPFPQRTVHLGRTSDPLAVQLLAGGKESS